MAIRKFRKKMKPFILIITVVFILSLLYGGYQSFMYNRAQKKATEAFKLNGKYVTHFEIEREKQNILQNLNQNPNVKIELDQDILTTLAIDTVVKNRLMNDIAKNLGIKISSKEVNDLYEEQEKMIGDKDQFKRMLKARGHSTDSFKDTLKSTLTNNKIHEKLLEEVEVSDAEALLYLIRTKNFMEPSAFMASIKNEETLSNIKNMLKSNKAILKYGELVGELVKKAEIENVADIYKDKIYKEEFIQNGISITNVDISENMAEQSIYSQLYSKPLTKEELYNKSVQTIKENLKIVEIAKNKGIALEDNNLGYTNALLAYTKALRDKLKADVKITEKESQEFFKYHQMFFDKHENYKVDFLTLTAKVNKNDIDATKAKAEKYLKELTTQNFIKKAKEISNGDTILFQDLGTFKKGQMVKEFEDALLSAKPNEIIGNAIKTDFGYHIIYVENISEDKTEFKAKHILFRITPQKENLENFEKTAEKIKDDLKENKLLFDKVKDLDNINVYYSNLVLSPEISLSNIDPSKKLDENIKNSKLNEINLQKIQENVIIIFRKISEQKYTKAKYEDNKETVNEIISLIKVDEEIEKLFKKK